MRRFAQDASDSHKTFVEVVWPEVASALRGGEFLPVEGVTDDELRRHLDQLAGIDAWQLVAGEGMRGIASRVQPGHWDTFTIRYERDTGNKTEWEKRCYALDNPASGWLLPALTIQAYVNDGVLNSVAVVRTADLFAYAREHLAAKDRQVWIKGNRPDVVGDSNTFVVVPWSNLRRSKIRLCVRPSGHVCKEYDEQKPRAA